MHAERQLALDREIVDRREMKDLHDARRERRRVAEAEAWTRDVPLHEGHAAARLRVHLRELGHAGARLRHELVLHQTDRLGIGEPREHPWQKLAPEEAGVAREEDDGTHQSPGTHRSTRASRGMSCA